MLALLLATALAVEPDALLARVAETEPLRAHRLAEQPQVPTEATYRAAAGGKVVTGITPVDGHSAKIGWGVGVIDAPIDAVWRGINDELNHGELLPISFVALVSGAPCSDRRQVLMVLPLPIISNRWWVNENRYNTDLHTRSDGQLRELRWSSLSDPTSAPLTAEAKAATNGAVPVAFNKGAWLLIALSATQTLAEYHSWVDPGGRLPAGPASLFATNGITDTFTAMGKYARAGQSKCP